MMEILFDGLCLTGNLSGVQYYTEHLMSEAAVSLEGTCRLHAVLTKEYCDSHAVTNSHTICNVRSRIQRIVYEHLVLPKKYTEGDHQILHCPAYILPIGFRGRSVVTVHDIIALDYPKLCKTTNALYFRLFLERSIRQADRIIAVSHKVKSDILRRFDVDEDKIAVTHLGIDPLFRPVKDSIVCQTIRSKYGLPEDYLLFVGNIEPKKNLVRLIRAYNQLRHQHHIDHKLILVGQLAWKYREVIEVVKELKLTDKVLFLHYVPVVDLPVLYTMADLFVFPSLYEGFGLPPLEAMACGTPVVTSTAGALHEVTNGYALYADPSSVEDIAEKIMQGISDQTWRDSTGVHYAQSQTWQKTWAETTAIYQSLL